MSCHSERSEESLYNGFETRFTMEIVFSLLFF